jgi:AraC-like DNA-binding protein
VTDPALPEWGILVESHSHAPGFRTELHRHRSHSLIFVVSGGGLCRCGGREHALGPNSVVLLRAREPHQLIDRPRAAMVVFVVYFSDAVAEVQALGLAAARPAAIALPPHRARRVRSLMRELLFEQSSRPAHYRLAMRQALAAALLELHRAALELRSLNPQALASRDRVRMVLDYVTTRYYRHHGLADAARMAGLSQRQFSTLCRALTGESYLRHLNGVRLSRARELIEGSGMPVSAAAFEVGFEDLSTFYRAFRRRHGGPPLELARAERRGSGGSRRGARARGARGQR